MDKRLVSAHGTVNAPYKRAIAAEELAHTLASGDLRNWLGQRSHLFHRRSAKARYRVRRGSRHPACGAGERVRDAEADDGRAEPRSGGRACGRAIELGIGQPGVLEREAGRSQPITAR